MRQPIINHYYMYTGKIYKYKGLALDNRLGKYIGLKSIDNNYTYKYYHISNFNKNAVYLGDNLNTIQTLYTVSNRD